MSLKEDIDHLGDVLYDDYKWDRHWTPESPASSEESIAHRRVEAWERIKAAALESEDLRGENYKLRGIADGWKTYTDNLEQLIKRLQDRVQQSGIQIAELLAEREEISVRLHRG